MSTRPFFAHSLPGAPEAHWELLEDHLEEVARRAAEFAGAFDSAPWGDLAGRWHDLGKYRQEFQRRIRGSREQAEHAGAGAVLAADRGLIPLAFAIAGHHAGLANPSLRVSGPAPLRERLAENRQILAELLPHCPEHVLAKEVRPEYPSWANAAVGGSAREVADARRVQEFWVRMLFSALVDADRLATEQFTDPGQSAMRAGARPVEDLWPLLERRLAAFRQDSRVNQVRRAVLEDCIRAAGSDQGFFSLTVPTGGGKTLSGMAFALRHALQHGLRRIVVAIPFTSIIEQNAEIYRDIFGTDQVIEHHSNVDESERREQLGEAEVRRALACENWDAPLIVTTNVQLFESLFSNRPSRCRRLHNLARSVIVLDEAQALPAGFLLPVMDVLKELVSHYGCTVVLSTATQPALARREALPSGLADVREIVTDPAGLAGTLTRVTVRWPVPTDGPITYEALAERMVAEHQVLAIVHRRVDARMVAVLLPAGERYHLSALMCPSHRREVLGRARSALGEGRPCRLVTTQLIEAGVDIDFPVVFRALAGLDSLVQAAGRCNREGRLVDDEGRLAQGRFEIFVAPTEPPAGLLRRGLDATRAMLQRYPKGLDFGQPAVTEEYFRLLFGAVSLDAQGIQSARAELNFATTAERFRLIDSATWPVVVPWDESAALLARHAAHQTRATFRSLQPLTVQVYDQQLRQLHDAGAVAEVSEGLFSLLETHRHLYDPEFGLLGGPEIRADPATLIA